MSLLVNFKKKDKFQMENILNFINQDTITGAITTLIIPGCIKIYQVCRDKNQFDKFKKMIDEEYIKPIENTIKDYHSYIENPPREEIENKSKKLDYLLKNEINYLNSNNQFKIIRLIEYTKCCFRELNNVSIYYGFKAPDDSYDFKEDKEKSIELKNIVQKYKDTREKYIKLEIDNFPLEKGALTHHFKK